MPAQLPPRLPGETDQVYSQRVATYLARQVNITQGFGATGIPRIGVGQGSPSLTDPLGMNLGSMWDAASMRPQQPQETDVGYGARQFTGALRNPFDRAWNTYAGQVQQPIAAALDTPAARGERATARAQRDGQVAAQGAEGPPVPRWSRPGRAQEGWFIRDRPGASRDGGRRRHLGYDMFSGAGQPLVIDRPVTVSNPRSGGISGNRVTMTFDDGTVWEPMHLPSFPRTGRYGPGELRLMPGLTGTSGRGTPHVHMQPMNDLARGHDAGEYFGVTGAPTAEAMIAARRAQMGDAADNFGAAPPPLDTTGFDTAERNSRQIQRLESTPYSFNATEAPRPDRPAPTPFAAPDFTAGNVAFEKSQPTNPFDDPEERTRFLRQNYFRGMAQGLLSMNWAAGPGVGELLAKIGAGALNGRLHGDDEIRQRQDRFDVEMRQYQQALANRNDSQATQISNVANQNIASMNQHNNNLYADRAQDWARNLPQVQDGQLITRTPGANGRVTTTVTPVGPAAQIRHLNRMSDIAIGRSGQTNQYNSMVWGAQREDARTALAYEMQNPDTTPQQRDQAMLYDMADRIGAAVSSGQWTTMMPNQAEADTLRQRAYTAIGVTPVQQQVGLPSDLQQRVDDYITAELVARTVNGGADAMRQVYQNPQASAAYINRRNNNRRESTRIDQRGRISRSTSQSFGND